MELFYISQNIIIFINPNKAFRFLLNKREFIGFTALFIHGKYYNPCRFVLNILLFSRYAKKTVNSYLFPHFGDLG
jgi:hypothetical protein